MIYISRDKFIAILCYCLVNTAVYLRGDNEQLRTSLLILGVILIPIFLSRIYAWFSSWGFMESLARDFGKGVSAGHISFFYWLVFAVVSLFFLFNWRLY